MKNFKASLSTFLVRYRKLNFFIALTVVLVLSLFTFRIRYENSTESFINEKDPGLQYYRSVKATFGDDQIIVLAIPMEDVFTYEHLTEIDRVSEALKKIPHIQKVRSLTSIQDIVGSEGGFEVKPFIEDIPKEEHKLAEIKAAALSNPLYKLDLVSRDGKIASILIEAKVSKNEARYKQILHAIKDTLENSKFKNAHYIAGDPLVELEMTQEMWRDLGVFLPVTYLCLLLLFLAFFRSFRLVVGPLVTISLQLMFLFGLMGIWGIAMSAVTVGLPSLMLCISVLEVMHVLSLYRVRLSEGDEWQKALHWTLEHNLGPCFWTTLTTVLGFLSVGTSELPPIRHFGFLAAATTAAALPICFMTLPFFMSFMRQSSSGQSKRESEWVKAFFAKAAVIYRNKAVMWIFIIVTILASAWGTTKIKTETMLLKFIRPESDVRKAVDYIQENLAGVSVLEIIVDTHREDGIKEPAVLKEIEALQAYLESVPVVDKITSPVQFIKEMHQSMNEGSSEYYHIPDSKNLIAQYILAYSFSGRDNDFDDFVDYNYRQGRVTARISEQSSKEIRSLLKTIHSYTDIHMPKDLTVKITSHAVIQANMTEALVEGQIKGFGLEFIVMFLIFFITCGRSLFSAGLALIPNLIPILASLGLMGYAGITMNSGTAMTCTIAFGLVVDDTIHFLEHAKFALKKDSDPARAVTLLFQNLGPAIIQSSLVLSIGFVILVFGYSRFTALFGLICAFAIFSAMICEILVTPFLVIHSARFRKALLK